MATRSKVWVCGRSPTEIVGSNLAGGYECLSVMSVVVCCQVEVTAFGLITRPEESYRVWCVWVWSWNIDKDEALAHWGAVAPWKCVTKSNRLVVVCSRDLSCISGGQINGLLGSVIQVGQVRWENDQSTRKQAGRINYVSETWWLGRWIEIFEFEFSFHWNRIKFLNCFAREGAQFFQKYVKNSSELQFF